MAGITPVDDSLKEWNIFFSRDILINVPHTLHIQFNCPPNTQLLYKGTVYLDALKDNEKEKENLRSILQTGHQMIASDNQRIITYNIDTQNPRTQSCKIGKVEMINQICDNDQFGGQPVLTVSLKMLMTIPFMKFDMVCVFATKEGKLVCVPMKGLTSFVLEIRDTEVVANKELMLERKTTRSQKGHIQSSGQSVMVCTLKGTQQLFEKQIKIHQSLRCSQISSFVYAVPSKSMLIFECPKKWTLKQYLLDNNGKTQQLPISRSLLIKFCLDISKAMNYLQVSQIVHRDLSAESVFVYSTDPHDYVNCKLGDVCCCERVSEKGFESGMTRPIYNNHAENFRMPPEISSKESAYTSQCDIYSFGILMFHILTGYLNTNPINESGNMSPMYTRQMPPACVNIIDMCCAMNANERPKFSVVVERIKTIFQTEMKDENRVVRKKEMLKYPLV